MTYFKAPTQSFINIIKIIDNWKIVVISNTKNIKINNFWKLLNFPNNLIYLTLKNQINLGYEITKYLKLNSNSRKILVIYMQFNMGKRNI